VRWLALVFLAGCVDGTTAGPRKLPRVVDPPPARDDGVDADAGHAAGDVGADVAPTPADAAPDSFVDPDSAADGYAAPDAARDVFIEPDLEPDAFVEPDSAPDAAPPAPDVAVAPPGRRACGRGEGWTLFELHWDGSTSARVDHWDASCEYSGRINDACGAFARCGPGDGIAGCNVELVDGGEGLLVDGNDDLLIRFSVLGLRFGGATLYFQARGTRGGGEVEISSPLYGGLVGPVAGQYEWLAVDWGGLLRMGDDPGLTAIGFDAARGDVAIHAVELCLTE